MDIQKFRQRLYEVSRLLENHTIDEIPLDARPEMMDFDFNKDSFVIVSYSRKDFEKVYLFLAYLYNDGCRFWYDAGMLGTDKWINEFKEKYENPNCLGTITFYSENYISDSTKAELDVIFKGNAYSKQNMMISMMSLTDMIPDQVLKAALFDNRISIENAAAIKPILTELIQTEKERTIHRYGGEEDIPALVDKFEKIFSVQECHRTEMWSGQEFSICNGVLYKYIGQNKNVTIPRVVHTISKYAFQDCTTVTHITVPDSVNIIEEAAFMKCSALESIVLPDSVCFIGEKAFEDCVSLKTISLPRGIDHIYDRTFAECRELTTVDIPDTIYSIGEGAFESCYSLENISIPDSVVIIGEQAFSSCNSLRNITIPAKVSIIWQCTFEYCTALENVTISDGVTEIRGSAFEGCTALKAIHLPDSVVEMSGFEIFGGCTALKKVSLSKNLAYIPPFAFSGCKELSDIIIPNGVVKIDFSAFAACTSLTHITIPDSVTEIVDDAFSCCTALSEVIIPTSITQIKGTVFFNCGSLTQLSYMGTVQQWEQVWFQKQFESVKRIQCVDGIVEVE